MCDVRLVHPDLAPTGLIDSAKARVIARVLHLQSHLIRVIRDIQATHRDLTVPESQTLIDIKRLAHHATIASGFARSVVEIYLHLIRLYYVIFKTGTTKTLSVRKFYNRCVPIVACLAIRF